MAAVAEGASAAGYLVVAVTVGGVEGMGGVDGLAAETVRHLGRQRREAVGEIKKPKWPTCPFGTATCTHESKACAKCRPQQDKR